MRFTYKRDKKMKLRKIKRYKEKSNKGKDNFDDVD